ncbi:MAG: GSU2403 family nucleotidyltransferase fold protein, partial [Caldimonas sp.]
GTTQWYFAFREADQRVRQIYVGPDTDDVRNLIDKAAAAKPLARLEPLARSALALGCAAIERKHLSVISRLGEYGFFRAGGVLVGTHAFLAFANQLGVRWLEADQTADVDFAHAGRNVSIALPASVRAEAHTALTTMVEGFLPLVQYRGQAGASYRHRDEPEFQVDFLTPRTGDDDSPLHVDNLDVALQPLRFMEFSLEDVQQATLFDRTGRTVVVSLPAPARYAVHKLLIVGERTGRYRAKSGKDVAQAAALAAWFMATDPDPLAAAWADALSRGPGWRKRALEGRKALLAKAPELGALLST